jgi:YD repeat-containing protein
MREETTEDCEGNPLKISYHENGQMSRLEYANGDVAVPTYDSRGNIVLVKWNDGSEDRWEYDENNECVAAVFFASTKES